MVPRWLQSRLELPVGTESYTLLYVSNSQASTAGIVTATVCRHKNIRAYISGDDGAASVTRAAPVHVVPIYDLGTAFSISFKPQTATPMGAGASSSSVGRVYCNYFRLMGISGSPPAGFLH